MMKIVDRVKVAVAPIRERARICLSAVSPSQKRQLEAQKAFYSQFVKAGELVFDIGANLGDKTRVFCELGARVISVEPQPHCAATIKRRFKARDGIVVVEKGVAEREGSLKLSVCDRSNAISTFSDRWKDGRFKDFEWNRRIDVPVTTLDRLIDEYGAPSFCKIDVEGFELNVLKGLSRPIRHISFEYTREFFDEAKLCMKRIAEIDPGVRFNCTTGSLKLMSGEWLDRAAICERLEAIDKELLYGEIYSRM